MKIDTRKMSSTVRHITILTLLFAASISLKAQLRESIGKSDDLEIELQSTKMPKAEMEDERLELLVRNACDPIKHGKALKVVLTDGNWNVRESNAGVPVRQYLGFQVATEKNGHCYLLPGAIRKKYLGGGKYGPEHISIIESVRDRTKMHCNNIIE